MTVAVNYYGIMVIVLSFEKRKHGKFVEADNRKRKKLVRRKNATSTGKGKWFLKSKPACDNY